MSKSESITKSQIFYRGYLPGGMYRMRNQCSVIVTGVRNNEVDARNIYEEQLYSVMQRYINAWEERPNARVSSLLLQHLEEPEANVRIVTPEAIYVQPFPIMLKCTSCHAIDFFKGFKEDDERLREMKKRLINRGGRKRISCSRPSCNGILRQMPYTSVHRCGSVQALSIPPQLRRTKHVGFKDVGSTFAENRFFDVDHPTNAAHHALQEKCPMCKTEFEDAEGLSRRASPVRSSNQMFPHNIHYLSLSKEMGVVLSNAGAIVGTPEMPLSQQGLSIAEGLFSCLIGNGTPDELVEHIREIPGVDDTSKDHIEELRKRLRDQESTRDSVLKASAALDEGAKALIAENFNQAIEKLKGELKMAEGRFSSVKALVGEGRQDIFHHLASNRRAFETAVLPLDCKASRKTLSTIALEAGGVRTAQLQQDRTYLSDNYHIAEIAHYGDINVVMGSVGYTRERNEPPEGPPGGVVPTTLMGYEDRSSDSTRTKSTVYALRAQTEAIEIKLCPRAVLKWCVDGAGWADPGADILGNEQKAMAYLLEHSRALRMDPVDVMAGTKDLPHYQSAPFHLLHTIAHCLVGSVKRHTGYDEKSISEYLLPMNLSILLYVSSVQNYTSGGLSMLMNHYLRQWFDDANNYALSCVFDPICTDKGSSCSGCIQIVLGCETFNSGISRCYIHGGRLEEEAETLFSEGFWG